MSWTSFGSFFWGNKLQNRALFNIQKNFFCTAWNCLRLAIIHYWLVFRKKFDLYQISRGRCPFKFVLGRQVSPLEPSPHFTCTARILSDDAIFPERVGCNYDGRVLLAIGLSGRVKDKQKFEKLKKFFLTTIHRVWNAKNKCVGRRWLTRVGGMERVTYKDTSAKTIMRACFFSRWFYDGRSP